MSGDTELVQRLVAIENRLAAIERLLASEAQTVRRPGSAAKAADAPSLSVTEYVLRIKPVGDVERTLVLASFLEEHRHLSSFSSEDIANLFLEARIKKPTNVADKIGKNVSKGLLMPVGEVDGKRAWRLTLTGQAYIKEREQ